jgi:hypothetical protein
MEKTMLDTLNAGLAALADDNARRAFLGAAYTELVGYDPFDDDAAATIADVAELLCGVMAEHIKADA